MTAHDASGGSPGPGPDPGAHTDQGPRRLRSAVIGTGFVGPHHVDGIRRGGYADVVAIVGTDAARTEARARALGVPRGTADVGEILRDESIDVVHICTPNATHLEHARAALEAGKHVVVEKPLALTSADADALVALAAERGRHGAVAFTYRGYPMVRRARAIVAADELGEIRLVHGAYLQDWLLEATDYNWRLESELGGASRAVADIGSHWFDTAEFISGRRVTEVFADLATFITTRRRPAEAGASFQAGAGPAQDVRISSEDAATILVRFENGARGACVVSQVSAGRKNAFTLEVDGSRKTLAWAQEQPNELWLGARDGGSTVLPREPDQVDAGVPSLPPGHPEGWGEAFRDLFRPLYAAILRGEAPPRPGEFAPYPTLADGARAARFVEMVLASSANGRWEPLPARVHG